MIFSNRTLKELEERMLDAEKENSRNQMMLSGKKESHLIIKKTI